MWADDSHRTASFHVFRLVLGFIYFHFGILKFFPDLSPAELLASQTIKRISSGVVDANTALYCLAIMERLLGLAFIFNIWIQLLSVLFFFHMLGKFASLLVLPELTFKVAPLAPTLKGQYIIKNLVFVAAGWSILLPELFPNKPVTKLASASVLQTSKT